MPVSQTSTRSACKLLLVGGEEGGQGGEPDLLLAFEQNGDVAGQRARCRLKARQASMKVISWPLSSATPRADDLRAGRRLDEPRLEGRRLPEVERVRPAARRNGRRTEDAARRAVRLWRGRRPSDAPASAAPWLRSPATGKLVLQPFRRLQAGTRIGGIGRNRRDRNEREKALQRRVLIGVDLRQRSGELCHSASSSNGIIGGIHSA